METLPDTDPHPDRDQRFWGMLCHLSGFAGLLIPFGSLLAPLLIWLMKKEKMGFVDQQGKEALNFQITCLLGLLLGALLAPVLIGFLILLVVAVGWLVLMIVAAVNASDGKPYRYPFSLRLIK